MHHHARKKESVPWWATEAIDRMVFLGEKNYTTVFDSNFQVAKMDTFLLQESLGRRRISQLETSSDERLSEV